MIDFILFAYFLFIRIFVLKYFSTFMIAFRAVRRYALNVIFIISRLFRERIDPKGVVGGWASGGRGTRMKIDFEKRYVLQLYSFGVYL